MSQLKKCSCCGLPETYETIEFDDDGVCNICRSTQYKKKSVNWEDRKKKFDQIVETYRGKYDYDCIVPFSGGKDSTFQLYYLCTTYKIKPLVIRFNHGFLRPIIRRNTERTLKKLGVDFIEFTPNWKIVKLLMRESFMRKTDFCWHCHCGIYSYPLRLAVKLNVPLVVWGEPLSEISAYYDYKKDDIEYEDEEKFNMCRNLGISADDMHGMISTPEHPVDRRDLLPYTYPSAKELRAVGVMSICLGSFIPWDYIKNTALIKKELGWESDVLEGVPEELHQSGEKIECFMQGARDYVKYCKRGYSRITQMIAFHIRNGRMTLEEAASYYDSEGRKPPSLQILLEYLGLTEKEFKEIVQKTEVSPFHHDYSRQDIAEQAWDFEHWYREDNRKK
ncbi:MAG: N-acetyl sugar amidotransferase [Verrucomicrobia bacterium]|nr:N-acetyl sugar amidotransferase [Verrucomicrobiota bacterium]MBU4248030.1 N-acetyl sugar amidotransferase [Verrucomicrobiota bacterium]MBU4289532.1 N-acetyl sugar amidotransferase [Verrucomicrobiota bacterium]MBU4496511.1 N-acetyl sugar amidotransferase [Verrucomicrobiota bacterium]MCG2678524.1 N-acetyl sugar amidotransferase [Kiritimatiellia bacterium]